MVKLQSFTYDVGYPIYGAKFINDQTLIVAGGGGEGKNGIPNKLTACTIDPERKKKPIKRYRELTLPDDEDCPMSLDVNNNVILLGINQSSESIKRGENNHFRVYKYINEHLRFIKSDQISTSKNANEYQKLTCLSSDGTLGVFATSDDPSVYIVEMDDLVEKYKIAANKLVKDISISPDGKMMCYITPDCFELISTITGRSVFRTDTKGFKEFDSMVKVEFADNNTAIIAGISNKSVILGEFSVPKSAIVRTSIISNKVKSCTSMHTKNNLIAIATGDNSIAIVKQSNFKLIKLITKVHNFTITKVTFSDDGKYLASVSAANTINVLVIPPNLATAKPLYLSFLQTLLSIVLMVVLAYSSQYLYANGYLHRALEYIKKETQDSSSYFTILPIEKSETFLSGAPTETTYIPEVTEDSSSLFSILPLDSSETFLSGAPTETTYVPEEAETLASILPVDESEVFLSGPPTETTYVPEMIKTISDDYIIYEDSTTTALDSDFEEVTSVASETTFEQEFTYLPIEPITTVQKGPEVSIVTTEEIPVETMEAPTEEPAEPAIPSEIIETDESIAEPVVVQEVTEEPTGQEQPEEIAEVAPETEAEAVKTSEVSEVESTYVNEPAGGVAANEDSPAEVVEEVKEITSSIVYITNTEVTTSVTTSVSTTVVTSVSVEVQYVTSVVTLVSEVPSNTFVEAEPEVTTVPELETETVSEAIPEITTASASEDTAFAVEGLEVDSSDEVEPENAAEAEIIPEKSFESYVEETDSAQDPEERMEEETVVETLTETITHTSFETTFETTFEASEPVISETTTSETIPEVTPEAVEEATVEETTAEEISAEPTSIDTVDPSEEISAEPTSIDTVDPSEETPLVHEDL